MPAARKPSGGSKTKTPSVEVVLEVPVPKKHSVRFETETDGQAISNVYLATAAYNALGKPSAIKLTIEAHEPES